MTGAKKTMERRNHDNRQKQRKKRWKNALSFVCMAGFLLMIVYHQRQVMEWMNLAKDKISQWSYEENSVLPKSLPNEEDAVEDFNSSETIQDEQAFLNQAEPEKKLQQKNQQEEEASLDLEQKVEPSLDLEQQTVEAGKISKIDSQIRGVYFSARKVSSGEKVDRLIESLKGTQMNAVVIDVKDDSGNITFHVDNAMANKIGAVTNQITDVKEMLQKFHENGIYVIGRVVAFKDPILAANNSTYAIKKADETIFFDRAGDTWLNPYNEKCWKYLIDIASEAAILGFDEIQFDYVRFSTEAKAETVSFGVNAEKYTKTQVITDFIQYAVKRLHQYDTSVSADVFGAIINSEIDSQTVGQDYIELSRYLDYICPMIYPSHYADGSYGIDVPDLEPYQLILEVLTDSANQLSVIDPTMHCAVVRPWLQDFTASWKKSHQTYGVKQVNEQIDGVYDAGYSQWLFWNSSGKYSATKQ